MSSARPEHSDTINQCFRVCLEQVQNLDNSGYTIRNTFIHSGASSLKGASASQRVHSAPPPSRKVDDLLEIPGFPDGEWWSAMLSRHEPQQLLAPLMPPDFGDSSVSPDRESCASTTCSDNDPPTAHNSFMMHSGGQLACSSASASKVAELVMSECQFLRLQEYCLLPEISRKAMRCKSKWMLRFYVHGVPCQKRAKWLQPLSVSVAAVLRRRGCTTKVHSCELFVTLENDGEVIHIDFAAARC